MLQLLVRLVLGGVRFAGCTRNFYRVDRPHNHPVINHYMQALLKYKSLQVTGICILTELLGIQLLTIMCNSLYFQGQGMETRVSTEGLYPSRHSEKLLFNHRNKSRKETDGVQPQRHKRSIKLTPSISSFADRPLQLSDVYLHVFT